MFVRYVVYSTTEKKILWSKYFDGPGTSWRPIPILLGKSSIYCMREIEDEYTIYTYDIRSGKFLYESPKYPLYPMQRTTTDGLGTHIGFQVVPVNGGKELLLGKRTMNSQPYETMFHIIDGETGIKLHSVTYPHCWSCLLYPDPISAHVVVVFDLYSTVRWNRVLKNLRTFSIIQKFTYQDEKPASFSLVSTGVVFPPNIQYNPYGYSSLDPLSMTGAFCLDGHDDGAQGSAITPTRGKDFLFVAADVLRQSYPKNDPPPLNQCFVFGRGKSMTLPPRPEFGRHERTSAGLPQFFEVKDLQFGDGGRMHLYCHPDTYIFEF